MSVDTDATGRYRLYLHLVHPAHSARASSACAAPVLSALVPVQVNVGRDRERLGAAGRVITGRRSIYTGTSITSTELRLSPDNTISEHYDLEQ